MKKLLFLCIFIFCQIFVFAQNVAFERNENNFTQVTTVQTNGDIQTFYTYTIDNVKYPIWVTKTGRCYIIRTLKSGNKYKQFLEKDICLQICEELHIEYTEKD